MLGHAADEILRGVEFAEADATVCRDWERGQSASLRHGVEALASSGRGRGHARRPAVHHPAGDRRRTGPSARYDAVRCTYDGTPGHPVVLGRRVLDAVGELEGDQGARELLSRFRVKRWEAGHLCSAMDVDTKEELCRL